MKKQKTYEKTHTKKKASCEFQDEFTNAKNEAPTWSNMLSSWHTIQGTDQTVGLGSSWFHLRHICSTSAAHLQHICSTQAQANAHSESAAWLLAILMAESSGQPLRCRQKCWMLYCSKMIDMYGKEPV
jgi:hypothetical protein